jgi:hypothetical protein
MYKSHGGTQLVQWWKIGDICLVVQKWYGKDVNVPDNWL